MAVKILKEYKGIKIGDKVNCTDDEFFDDHKLPYTAKEIKKPKDGKPYHIREIIDTGYGVGVRLKEIKNKEFYFDNIKQKQEPIFAIERFELSKK